MRAAGRAGRRDEGDHGNAARGCAVRRFGSAPAARAAFWTICAVALAAVAGCRSPKAVPVNAVATVGGSRASDASPYVVSGSIELARGARRAVATVTIRNTSAELLQLYATAFELTSEPPALFAIPDGIGRPGPGIGPPGFQMRGPVAPMGGVTTGRVHFVMQPPEVTPRTLELHVRLPSGDHVLTFDVR